MRHALEANEVDGLIFMKAVGSRAKAEIEAAIIREQKCNLCMRNLMCTQAAAVEVKGEGWFVDGEINEDADLSPQQIDQRRC
jgi:hypothetical protein